MSNNNGSRPQVGFGAPNSSHSAGAGLYFGGQSSNNNMDFQVHSKAPSSNNAAALQVHFGAPSSSDNAAPGSGFGAPVSSNSARSSAPPCAAPTPSDWWPSKCPFCSSQAPEQQTSEPTWHWQEPQEAFKQRQQPMRQEPTPSCSKQQQDASAASEVEQQMQEILTRLGSWGKQPPATASPAVMTNPGAAETAAATPPKQPDSTCSGYAGGFATGYSTGHAAGFSAGFAAASAILKAQHMAPTARTAALTSATPADTSNSSCVAGFAAGYSSGHLAGFNAGFAAASGCMKVQQVALSTPPPQQTHQHPHPQHEALSYQPQQAPAQPAAPRTLWVPTCIPLEPEEEQQQLPQHECPPAGTVGTAVRGQQSQQPTLSAHRTPSEMSTAAGDPAAASANSRSLQGEKSTSSSCISAAQDTAAACDITPVRTACGLPATDVPIESTQPTAPIVQVPVADAAPVVEQAHASEIAAGQPGSAVSSCSAGSCDTWLHVNVDEQQTIHVPDPATYSAQQAPAAGHQTSAPAPGLTAAADAQRDVEFGISVGTVTAQSEGIPSESTPRVGAAGGSASSV